MESLHQWETGLKANLRERGYPATDVDRRADELMRRVFRPEWIEALRNYQCILKDTFLRGN